MYNRIKGFLEVNKAGEHPAIFIIVVLSIMVFRINMWSDVLVFFCKPHLAIIDHMVFI